MTGGLKEVQHRNVNTNFLKAKLKTQIFVVMLGRKAVDLNFNDIRLMDIT